MSGTYKALNGLVEALRLLRDEDPEAYAQMVEESSDPQRFRAAWQDAVAALNGRIENHRSDEEIRSEIESLRGTAKDYDTELQTDNTCLATGAHDALRWALGLAEESISEVLKPS